MGPRVQGRVPTGSYRSNGPRPSRPQPVVLNAGAVWATLQGRHHRRTSGALLALRTPAAHQEKLISSDHPRLSLAHEPGLTFVLPFLNGLCGLVKLKFSQKLEVRGSLLGPGSQGRWDVQGGRAPGQGTAGLSAACRNSSQLGREGFLGATQGAAPLMRITRPLKCGSSCWSLARSWSTEPCDSRKVPIAHCGWEVGAQC